MKTILLIILAIIAIATIITLILCKTKEAFTEDIYALRTRTSEPNDIIDFNYGEYSYVTTSINPDPTLDPVSQPVLASFCFKSQGFLKQEWRPEYNNPLEIIKNEIPIRTSPAIHDITDLITRQTIYNAIKQDLDHFKQHNPELYSKVQKITANKDEYQNIITNSIMAGPVYAIFIHHPYYIENNIEESKKHYKDIYFNNANSKDFTPAYAIYNNGVFDTIKNTDVNAKNIKTQMLLLYPLYDKYTDELYQAKCDYYNLEQNGTDAEGNIKLKDNNNLLFKQRPCFSGITEMMRYFKSASYYSNLSYCSEQICNDNERKLFSLKFKLSNDANCFIKCKGSLSISNTDMKIVCGCASQFNVDDPVYPEESTEPFTIPDDFSVPEDNQYNTRCKSAFNTEIEDEKYYIYGFGYRINEELVVNNEIGRVTISQNDIIKLNESINPTKITENDKSYLKLINRCDT
jgi:hypothetical protein